MAEFEQALQSLLSDPDAMGQIMALANSLGGQQQESPREAPPEEAPPAPPPVPPDLGQLGPLLALLRPAEGPSREAAALTAALRPYLRGDRQEKLDRALRAVAFSQTARQALRLWKEGELHL